MSKFKNKKRIIIFSIIGIMLVSGILIFTNNDNEEKLSKEEYIQEVLETEEYSYLPEPAKNYVASVYEETGEVIKTEKNKEEGEPYLNPRYVDYLVSTDRSIVGSKIVKESEEELIKEFDLVPKEIIIDYYKGNIVSSYSEEELPTTYDLRNVNNNNYVTPIKNQDNLGLCWSFAANAQLESYLLKKNNQTYTSDATIFSERQMDYALSRNGINEYNNEKYGYRLLGEGGNFRYVTDIAKEGLSFTTQKDWETIYNNYFNSEYVYNNLSKMELKDVLNHNNSLYEVNSTIEMPYLNIGDYDINSEDYKTLKDSYLKLVKNYIMEYGGAYVGTGAPEYGCSIYNSDLENYIIYDNNKCNLGSHGMQIIGWDDSVEYEFCAADGITTVNHSIDISNCSEDRIVKGNGVWILKNSWGVTSNDFTSYTYLAYDSLYTDINMTTDISLTEGKEWDYSSKKTTSKAYHELGSNKKVKLNKVKFYVNEVNSVYNLYISLTNDINDYEIIDTITIEMPGLYTVDLSKKNIIVENGYYLWFADRNDGATYITEQFSYYSYLDEDIIINTYDATYKNTKGTSITDDYQIYVYSDTSNISSDSVIDYKLYDLEGNDISDNLSYKYNTVADDNVNSQLTISNSVAPGEYILETLYNNVVKCESKLYLSEIKVMNGSGTENDPYIITTPDELYMINDDMDAYYELGNDIDLTFDTSQPGGKFYNNGKGWIPIGAENGLIFSGSLDGKNYNIIGLTMSDSDYHGGLFYFIAPIYKKMIISIQNIIFKDINIESFTSYDNYVTNVGALAGVVTTGVNGKYYLEDDVNININNIAILDSKLSGRGPSASLVGKLSTAKENSLKISNIFSNAVVYNKRDYVYSSKGGIVGTTYTQNNFEENANIIMTNIQNIGKLSVNGKIYNDGDLDYNYGGIVGQVIGKLDLKNVINTSTFSNSVSNYKDRVNYGLIIGNYNYEDKYSTGHSTIQNIYYTQNYDIIGISNHTFSKINVLNKNVFDLKNVELYVNEENNWENFSDNWKIETIDNVKRIPILKFVDFDYLKVNEINDLYEESTINIYDYITPNNNLVKDKTIFEIEDDSIATIDEDGNITGIKPGDTILHIESEYDGYVNDITLNVKTAKYLLTFNSNYDEKETYVQKFADEEKSLISNKFDRIGYKFIKWNSSPDGTGISYNDEQLMSITDNLTLYAIWEPIKYTIRLYFNFGTNSAYHPIELYYDITKIIDLEYKRTGYRIANWNTKSDGSGESYFNEQEVSNLTTIDNDIINLYAIWEPIKYTIEFNSNDDNEKKESLELKYDEEVILTNIFNYRTGYKVANWNTLEDGSGTAYSSTEKISNLSNLDGDKITLYAIWEPIKYKVKFVDDNKYTEQEFTYDQKQKLKTNSFVKTGYTFLEWILDGDSNIKYKDNEEVINLTSEEETIILWATWSKNKYIIKFNSNGGTGKMENQQMAYDIPLNLSSNIFKKDGYKFKEWNTQADGKGVSYDDKQEVINLTSVKDDVINLYAIWEKVDLSVKVNNYKENNNEVSDISNSTTINNYLKNFSYNNSLQVKVYNHKNELITDKNKLIGTGSKIKFYDNDTLIDEFTNIVRADNTGDGVVDLADLSKLFNHYRGNITMSGVYLKASNIAGDSNVDLADLSKLYNYYRGNIKEI